MKTYGLKDQATGFYDRETDLKIVRDQTVTIDEKKKVGALTSQAIRAGRLIEVNREPKKAEKAQSPESDLPEDLQGRDALIAGGFDSVEKVKAASDEELEALKGVGKKTVEHVRVALA